MNKLTLLLSLTFTTQISAFANEAAIRDINDAAEVLIVSDSISVMMKKSAMQTDIKLKAKDKTTGDINILQVIAKIQVTPNGETINIELIQSFESGNGGYRAISMSLGALRAEEVNPFIESIADAKTREIVTEMIESVSQKNQTEKLAASLDRLGAALEGLTYSQMDKSLRIILTIMQSNPVAGH